jgi:hypothetical protein
MGSFLSLMTSSYSLICALGARHCGGAGAFCQLVNTIGVVTKPLLFAGSELPTVGVVTKPLLFAGSELLAIGVVTKLLLFAGSELP